MEQLIWFNKYEIIKKIGQGGSGEVFLANHIKLNSHRVVKRISKNHLLHNQLLQEAHILKDLKHSLIPIIYDFEEDNDYTYIILEYIDGQSLTNYMHQFNTIPLPLILNIGIQICELIEYLNTLNNPILYLDLKPDNIIISQDIVHLIDFGAASKITDLKRRTFSLGTKGYAPPELFTKAVPDERADIYGIGSLLYYIVTGNPYDGKAQKIPRLYYLKSYQDLYSIIKRCLAFHPSLRYSKVSVLKNKLIYIKNHTKNHTNNSFTIAIAGSQERIGVTHLSLLIASYLRDRAVYIEANYSNHLLTILNYRNLLDARKEIVKVEKCQLGTDNDIRVDNKIKVIDYGVLSNENRADFIKGDIKLLVLGGKEWELLQSERALKMIGDRSGVMYLFNYMNGKVFQSIIKHMGLLQCLRIPYSPDPFNYKESTHMKEFFSKIMEDYV